MHRLAVLPPSTSVCCLIGPFSGQDSVSSILTRDCSPLGNLLSGTRPRPRHKLGAEPGLGDAKCGHLRSHPGVYSSSDSTAQRWQG